MIFILLLHVKQDFNLTDGPHTYFVGGEVVNTGKPPVLTTE